MVTFKEVRKIKLTAEQMVWLYEHERKHREMQARLKRKKKPNDYVINPAMEKIGKELRK